MSSNEVNIIAEMRPKKGQTQKVLDLLREAATEVEQKEKGVTRYEIYSSMRTAKDGTDLVFMVERYSNKQALKEHGEASHFQAFQKKMAAQDLLSAPTTIHVLSQRGGHSAKL